MIDPKPNRLRSRVERIRRMIGWVAGITLAVLFAVLVFVPVDERVLATGTVSAAKDTRVYAIEDGVLDEIHVRDGDEVVAGQPLVSINATAARERLASAEAAIAKAHADLAREKLALERTLQVPLPSDFWNVREDLLSRRERLAQARSEYDRALELQGHGLLSASELEQARLLVELSRIEESKLEGKMAIIEEGLEETIRKGAVATYDAALATVKSIEAEREIHAAAIDRSVYRAPADGTVTLVAKRRPGQRVNRGDTLTYLAHGPPTRADLFADQNQFYRVKPGQRVLMRSGAFNSMRHGYIEASVLWTALQPESGLESPEVSPGGPAYRVVASIDFTPQPLMIGSTVEAKIILRRVPLWRLLFP